MKLQHLLTAILSGIILHFSLQFLYAPREIQELERYRVSLEKNVQDLLRKGDALEAMYYQLQDDPQAIVQEAHRIGMVLPGDTMIQVRPRERKVDALSSGDRVLIVRPNIQVATIIRNISLGFSLIVLFLSLAITGKQGSTKK